MGTIDGSLTSGSAALCAEFRVGTARLPYLADHGFQDLVVLPGAFYVHAALQAQPGDTSCAMANVRFHSPVVLSARDAVIAVRRGETSHGRVEYRFFEAGSAADDAANAPVASLEIAPSAGTRLARTELDPERFREGAQFAMESAHFYARLRDNGNQYGPHFQNVLALWRAGDECLGQLSVTPAPGDSRRAWHASLLDAMTQLLGAFVLEKNRTFVLQSVDRIELRHGELPQRLWGHATLTRRTEDGLHGDVVAFDSAGEVRLRLSGIALSLLDLVDAAEQRPAASLALAANFTAEPLQDSLDFWAEHFGLRISTEFAPYNQVFQQLLDPGSVLRRNKDGFNVILLSLEEWARSQARSLAPLAEERADQCFGARARYTLPNGLQIVHLNRYETDYVYKEIFEDQCYLRHGIRLEDDATVIDVGANIGLFSLFVATRCKNARIFACEPAPVVYDLLSANCRAYGTLAHPLNVGVSDRRKTARFTFYEKSSVFSGFHSDEAEDRAAIEAIVRNMLRESGSDDSVDEFVKELTADRLNRQVCECALVSVSDIIREHGLAQVDLLKIDAEKSEWDIVNGIAEDDWPKIRQIVLEIHDPSGKAIKRIEALLVAKGFRCILDQEKLLQRAGLYNLYATRDAAVAQQGNPAAKALAANVTDFAEALRSFMSLSPAPLLLGFCLPSPAAREDAALRAALADAEAALSVAAGSIANVQIIGSDALARRYPVQDYYDAHGHRAGHVPYTAKGYAAIGTSIARALFGLKRSPSKVIALDCDNTLWKGVCGEDGPLGIELPPPYRTLQEFMARQAESGMLLCLCTKNNEADVDEVFARRSDMPLRREHFVARRVNWSSKADNLRSLAKELNLGLDSFIFIDDNPVECAEVRSKCPSVLALELPKADDDFAAFLQHVWAFDKASVTEEDRRRTRMYRENAQRREYRQASLSLGDFVKGLELRVEVAKASEAQSERISQLTLRTNQFNLTTVRRSKAEIAQLLRRDDFCCLSVRVSDRFGDYGLVGVLIYEILPDRYRVDTLLLSCRVLGRGVEHFVASQLGARAQADAKRYVEVVCVPTPKNAPALDFMNAIGDGYRKVTPHRWIFPADRLAAVVYRPDEGPSLDEDREDGAAEQARPAGNNGLFSDAGLSQRLQRVAEQLGSMERLVAAMEQRQLEGQSAGEGAGVVDGNPVEAALLGIWRKILARPRIGLDENFFDAGGTSLKAVQIASAVRRELGHSVAVVHLFECPTVRLLAAKLSGTPSAPAAPSASVAVTRGQQRRYNTLRRKDR